MGSVSILCVFFNVFHQYFLVFRVETFPLCDSFYSYVFLSFLNFFFGAFIFSVQKHNCCGPQNWLWVHSEGLRQVVVTASAKSVHMLNCESVVKCTEQWYMHSGKDRACDRIWGGLQAQVQLLKSELGACTCMASGPGLVLLHPWWLCQIPGRH